MFRNDFNGLAAIQPGRSFLSSRAGEQISRITGQSSDRVRQPTPQAIEALQSIMNEQQALASARIAAAEALLNRGWGRPTAMLANDDEAGPLQVVVSWAGS
jgi:hypothetical protein